ncbi:hypothetical protein BDR07DRAFT_1419944 [Suillus spraguei]|nr:hypothetical protein BDR07DRAFT_1419944 [Suillus spraguei]
MVTAVLVILVAQFIGPLSCILSMCQLSLHHHLHEPHWMPMCSVARYNPVLGLMYSSCSLLSLARYSKSRSLTRLLFSFACCSASTERRG